VTQVFGTHRQMTDPLGFLIDRVPAETTVTLQIPAGADLDADAVGRILAAAFEADPDLAAVWLRQGQAALGTVRRRRLELLLGPRRSAEDGDGAQLPGVSTRYQLLQYRCLAPGCEIVELRVVLGTDGPSSCPRGHGPLELKA
jgi:hypothetical protein